MGRTWQAGRLQRQSKPRLMKIGTGIGVVLLVMMLVVGICWYSVPVQALPQPQIIIGPDDVSTPTPTSAAGQSPILLPTVTPTPGHVVETNGVGADVGIYTVKPGDTVWDVALEMGVDLEDMGCVAGPIFSPDTPLVIGDQLEAMPPQFRCHQVMADETLAVISEQYGVTAQQIAAVTWNRLPIHFSEHAVLERGRFLRIPPANSDAEGAGGFLGKLLAQPVDTSPLLSYAVGGTQPVKPAVAVPDNWPYGSGNFIWPTTGWLSQGYRSDHRAVDIASHLGTFVLAADRGVVIRAGWNDQGYGQFVVIDHNIDYVTLYAHLQEIYVHEGEIVAQGQIIGTVGSTGNSTGPHLHFEIRDFGQRTNPLSLLLR